MSSSSAQLLWPVTKRRPDGVILTLMGPGRATVAIVERFFDDLGKLGGERWLIDASHTTSYDGGAISLASSSLRRAHAAGLRQLVVVVSNSIVRMAVSVVAISSPVPIVAVATRTDAEAAIARPLP